MVAAGFRVSKDDQGRRHIQLFGQWSLRAPSNDFAKLKKSLEPFFLDTSTTWNLNEVEQLDAAGASVLLSGWGNRLNANISFTPEQATLFNTLIGLTRPPSKKIQQDWLAPLIGLGKGVLHLAHHFTEFIHLLILDVYKRQITS